MHVDGNGSEYPNYYCNSFDEMEIDQKYKEPQYRWAVILQVGMTEIAKGRMTIIPSQEIYFKSGPQKQNRTA